MGREAGGRETLREAQAAHWQAIVGRAVDEVGARAAALSTPCHDLYVRCRRCRDGFDGVTGACCGCRRGRSRARAIAQSRDGDAREAVVAAERKRAWVGRKGDGGVVRLGELLR